jgi:ribosomal protein S18 acetylase RimI-like enzyme
MTERGENNMAGDWVYRAESNPNILEDHLPAIIALGDSEKESLGFLPGKAYEEALYAKRIIGMVATRRGEVRLAGFVLFGGVFPSAKVQQIAVDPDHRRKGVGEALINQLVSDLERSGFQSVRAAVASDLRAAQAFYEKQGFVTRLTRPGGAARGRQIVLRARELENRSLLSLIEATDVPEEDQGLNLRVRASTVAPLYAIDLNVLFDAVKGPDRPRAALAERLIGSALAHRFRLAVAPEFVAELEKTSRGARLDPVLALAKGLPRLPAVNGPEAGHLCDLIHEIVFVRPSHRDAGTARAQSDARHLAEAALARASGYVTSDGAMIAARDELRRQVGIDVASLAEFAELLTDGAGEIDGVLLKGTQCALSTATHSELRAYFQQARVTDSKPFLPSSGTPDWMGLAIREAGEIRGAAILIRPANIDEPSRALVHIHQDQIDCEVLSDKLVDLVTEEACRIGPAFVELHLPAGQSVVREAARARGYSPASQGILTKIAVGRPITTTNWDGLVTNMRRKTGLALPTMPLPPDVVTDGVSVIKPDGSRAVVRLARLEAALAPTVIVWPGREGAIVPIARVYAEDLLQTTDQLPLFGRPMAAFLSRRTYVCSPRAEPLLRPSRPILFYESARTGGSASITAAGLIVDTLVSRKEQVPGELLKRAVVDDVDGFSTSSDVLAVSFESLMKFPRPVPLAELRNIGSAGTNNLQTATRVSASNLKAIFDYGWSRV